MKAAASSMKMPKPRTHITDPGAADRFVAAADEPEVAAIPKPAAAVAKPEPTKRLTLDLPVSLHRKFKKKAIDHDMTMMQFLIKAVEQWTRED